MFIGNTKSHDYHDEMNGQNFTEWWSQKLLSNLPEDNASFHLVKTDASQCPTTSTKKADLQKWQTERNHRVDGQYAQVGVDGPREDEQT